MKTKMIVSSVLVLALTACAAASTEPGDATDDTLPLGQSPEPTNAAVAGTDETPTTRDDGDRQDTPGPEPETDEPSPDETEPAETVDTKIEVTPTTVAPKTPPPSDDRIGGVEFAVTDLAQRMGVAPADVTVVGVEEVTWPDGSLGCPQPGMSYTQSLVNGTRVILEAAGVQYEYHSGLDGELFYCANPTDPVEESGYGDT